MARNRFNLQVGITFEGESAKIVEAEFRKMAGTVEREARRISASTAAINKQISDFKKMLGRGALIGLSVDALVKSLDAAVTRWAPNNAGARELTANLTGMADAVRRLDVAGVASNLGQFLGNAIAMHQQRVEEFLGGQTEVERSFERQMNLARMLANQGYDVAGASLTQLEAIQARVVATQRDLAGKVFGDPKAVTERANAFAQAAQKMLASGELNAAQTETIRKETVKYLDSLEEIGQVGPTALRALANELGAVSTRTQKFQEDVEKLTTQFRDRLSAAMERFDREQEQAAQRSRDLLASLDPLGQQAAELAEKERLLAQAREAGRITAEAYARSEANLRTEREALKKAMGGLTPEFLAPLDTPRTNPLDKWMKDTVAALGEVDGLMSSVGMSTGDWARSIEYVEANWERIGLSIEQKELLIARLGNRTVEWGEQSKKAGETFAQFAEKSWGTFIENAQGATADFFYDVLRNGKFSFEELGKGILDTFIRMIAELAARWLIGEQLMTAITAKEAAKRAAMNKAAAEAGGGGQGKDGGGMWGSVLKAFKGSGGGGQTTTTSTGAGLSGSAIAGIAAFAVVAAAAAYFKHRRDERNKERYETSAGVSGFGGSMGSGWQGRLNETGAQVAEALGGLFATIQETTRSWIDGMWSAQIQIRNDKKGFIATFQNEMLGTFATAGEAMIAAAKAGFAKAQNLDPLVRQVVENFEGTDPEAFASAISKVQEIADAISGVTEIEKTLQGLPAKISAIVGDLQMAGVAFGDAVVAAAKYGLTSFQSAWDSISGRQRTPAEEREMKERQRALLLAQLQLERARVAADYAALKAKAAIARGGAGLARAEIAHGVARLRGQRALVNGEASLIQAQAGVWNNYLNERADFVEVEAEIFNAELEALGAVLAELDKLIAEVSVGKIRIGGVGGGGGDIDVGGGGRGGGRSHAQEMRDLWKEAMEALRDWYKGLRLGQHSPLTPQQMLAEAQQQVAAAVAAIAGGGQGGLEALQNLPQLLDALLGAAGGVYGTSTAGYQGIFAYVEQLVASILGGNLPENVRAQLEALLGGTGALPPAGANSNQPGGALRLRPQDLDPLTTRLDMANLHLAAIRSSGARTANATEQMVQQLGRRQPAA